MTTTERITFSNPRLVATFDDWPSGSARVKCEFVVRRHKQGWRVSRRTTDKNGQWCKPKLTTFSGQAAIVDGSNGRTYILEVAKNYGFVTVRRSDFMNATKDELGFDASVFDSSNPELLKELLAVILAGGAHAQYVE